MRLLIVEEVFGAQIEIKIRLAEPGQVSDLSELIEVGGGIIASLKISRIRGS